MFIDTSDPTVWDPQDPTIVAEFYIVAVQDLEKFWNAEIEHAYDRNLVAYKCTLKMCLQRFRTTMRNSTTTTIMTKSQDSPEITFKSSDAGVLNVVDPDTSQTLSITEEAVTKLLYYLALVAIPGKATVNTGPNAPTSFSSDSARSFNASLYQNTPTVHQSGLEHRMNLLATSLSNALRNSSSDIATGNSSYPEICIHITYSWMTLPILLDVLALLLLVTTIFLTGHSGLPCWKSSQLPVLFGHGALEPRSSSTLPGPQGNLRSDLTTLEEEAKRSQLKLVQTDPMPGKEERWLLVDV
ncbi:hypothetical protein H2200_011292 [Cladophialophora chaetospira]|uniref:Uncharacterized protein n=1 Tax=Cladophialophora chaetospira TaxID=386627 RepID=A0AA38X0B8_9EURO|nr:hypothetical protein H2200_011292 [Cladophialophora chaetospira]